jgi:hypothetical protein
MKKMPKDILLLRELKIKVDDYFIKCNTKKVARSTDIYDYVHNKEPFKKEFQNARDFGRFLRRTHDKGFFTQLIPNSTVDTSIPTLYQWRFYPLDNPLKDRSTIDEKNLASSHLTTNSLFSDNKQYIASNGTKVRSKQELFIINKLLSEESLDIYYERPLKVDTYAKFPDFTVVNKKTKTVFHWEHFGINNNSEYSDKMTSKVQWYRDKGYRLIEEGGNLIITYFENDKKLYDSVASIIETIKSR